MRKFVSTLSLSILAGLLIGLGGFVNLYCNLKFNQPIAGAIFFTMGLIFVCFLGCNLFTGKAGYVFENKLSYTLDVLIMILGNFIGASIIGLIFMYVNDLDKTLLSNFINNKIATNTSTLSYGILFFKSVLAGVFVFFAVEAFKKFTSPVAKIIGVILSIGTMVLIGAEHSVANCFYFVASSPLVSASNAIFVLPSLLVSIIGNVIGSLFIWFLFFISRKIVLK